MSEAEQPRDKPRSQDGSQDPVAKVIAELKTGLPSELLLGKLRPPGQPRAYEPRLAKLSETRAAAHARAVRDIAAARFGFPTEKYRHFKTYTNVPTRSMGVRMGGEDVAFPDIVVVQSPENFAKILGEVEMVETVNEDSAQRRWRPFADLAPLYLYVPVGEGDRALQLCREAKAPIVGVRTWRYAVGVEEIEVNEHFTVPSGPEEMLPKILRPGS
jgi:hypothetical protein